MAVVKQLGQRRTNPSGAVRNMALMNMFGFVREINRGGVISLHWQLGLGLRKSRRVVDQMRAPLAARMPLIGKNTAQRKTNRRAAGKNGVGVGRLRQHQWRVHSSRDQSRATQGPCRQGEKARPRELGQ